MFRLVITKYSTDEPLLDKESDDYSQLLSIARGASIIANDCWEKGTNCHFLHHCEIYADIYKNGSIMLGKSDSGLFKENVK